MSEFKGSEHMDLLQALIDGDIGAAQDIADKLARGKEEGEWLLHRL